MLVFRVLEDHQAEKDFLFSEFKSREEAVTQAMREEVRKLLDPRQQAAYDKLHPRQRGRD